MQEKDSSFNEHKQCFGLWVSPEWLQLWNLTIFIHIPGFYGSWMLSSPGTHSHL